MLSHTSYRPSRDGVVGEAVFAARWQSFEISDPMGEIPDYPHVLFSILRWSPSQRDAMVAATIVQWFGTNCGNAFLWQARQLAALRLPPIINPYLAAWASENRRVSWVNHGRRALEGIMTRKWDEFGRPEEFLKLKLRDYEVAEELAAWLYKSDAQQFLADAKSEIKVREAARHRDRITQAVLSVPPGTMPDLREMSL